jgi:hypothetical protein
MVVPLTSALSKLFGCEPKKLAEYLNNPEAVNRATEYLKGKKLRTTYLDKKKTTREVKFGGFSLKPCSQVYAFEGFLGNF